MTRTTATFRLLGLFLAGALLVPGAACSRGKNEAGASGDKGTAGGEIGSMGGRAKAVSDPNAPDPGAVAQVGGKPVSYRAFERYLNDNAGEETEEGEQMNAIKSRLLDQFIEEQLLLKAAEPLKIVVSDAEVDAYLKELGLTEGDVDVSTPEGKDAFRERIKSGLIVQKVKESAVLSKIQVTDGEVTDELQKHPELTKASNLLVLKQILLDDRKTADEVYHKVATDPGQFESVARQRSISPDKGQPRSYAEEDLPADLRDAVLALQPGQVSPVQEHAQAYLIFQLVRKVEARVTDLADARKRVESELRRQKADQVMERYLADLKEKTEIHVNRSILPFEYVGEFRN
jgi:parvulin-like peptidyl-prolyl isomerase